MTGPPRPLLGFSFTPCPRAFRVARRQGRLSADEYDVLAELYDRAHIPTLIAGGETPKLTLAQLSESVGWPNTNDALSKLLRRLRDDHGLAYRIEQRRWYVFRLPRPGDNSEAIPSSSAPRAPSSRDPQSVTASGVAGTGIVERFEFGDGSSATAVPSSAHSVPSS